jgi:hypothetical protein
MQVTDVLAGEHGVFHLLVEQLDGRDVDPVSEQPAVKNSRLLTSSVIP